VPDPLRHHQHYARDSADASFMERVSEKAASGLGTAAFVVCSTVTILAWITVNALGVVRFDAYPFILLNLAFSAQAFYTGALVIIAQKAQTRTDKLNETAAAKHRDELDAANRALLEANTDLTQQVHRLAEQIHAAVRDAKPNPADIGLTTSDDAANGW
jgi:uncharacterized membrane protein